MKEKDLVRHLQKALEEAMPGCVIFKIADTITSGIPDLAITWGGSTIWLEVKYANPGLIDRKVQRHVMRRMASNGDAWYVIYNESTKETFIVHPGDIEGWKVNHFRFWSGFAHIHVAQWVKERLA